MFDLDEAGQSVVWDIRDPASGNDWYRQVHEAADYRVPWQRIDDHHTVKLLGRRHSAVSRRDEG
ncbi:hypothetical protein ACIPIC_35560 [Streptomyces collinus]|uniref:hypothetical protein n=1 Tax=Streptomyces collinus TaxID=42684 RepID=UPI003801CD1B